MKKIPCKLCPSCGKYSSINVNQCPCGADLTSVPGAAVDYNQIALPQFGRIDKDLSYYVRKCPVCSTEHFFTDPNGSVRVCRKCHKTQIGYQPTLPFEDEEKKPAPAKEPVSPVSPVVTGSAWGDDDDEDDEDDAPTGSAYDQMRKNIQGATGSAFSAPAGKGNVPDDDEDDEEEDSTPKGPWSQLLTGKGLSAEMSGIREPASASRRPKTAQPSAPKAPVLPVSPLSVGAIWGADDDDDEDEVEAASASRPTGSVLTATALCYGNLTFTLRSDSTKLPCLLGRSAEHATFLRQDPRVGNEHCYLAFRNGNWMVIEKIARNGTAVNGVFLPEGGSKILRDGDELKLGHHPDSMAFRISIRTVR